MGKKKGKGRSVKNNKNIHGEPEELVQAPHSFVIHKGLTGGHITELTKDFRKVMEPFTATHLKERKKNAIKDFVSVAGLLHVSHLSIFSRTELGGMYLKICKLPRGPTCTFKIHNFSLARDVVSSLKNKQLVIEQAFKHSPLIILNSFSGEGLHIKLMASMFQNMFPSINLTNVDLNDVRRCVLLNYNTQSKLIDFRHYTIKVVPVGISKGVKKVVQGKVPNLAKCNDMSEFFTKAGILSESEAEDDPMQQVTLPQKIITRGNMESGKSSIKLVELGPRLTLQLIKIEDGLLDGEVLYHDLIHKTEEEKLEIQKKREIKKKLKEKRKKIQQENKEAKEQAKEKLKTKSLEGMKKYMNNAEKPDGQENDDNDAEYYKEEVGEEPDRDLFTAKPRNTSYHKLNRKRKIETKNTEKDKRPFKKFKSDKKKSDKINSQNRDYRPIGGGTSGGVKKSFFRKRNK